MLQFVLSVSQQILLCALQANKHIRHILNPHKTFAKASALFTSALRFYYTLLLVHCYIYTAHQLHQLTVLHHLHAHIVHVHPCTLHVVTQLLEFFIFSHLLKLNNYLQLFDMF